MMASSPLFFLLFSLLFSLPFALADERAAEAPIIDVFDRDGLSDPADFEPSDFEPSDFEPSDPRSHHHNIVLESEMPNQIRVTEAYRVWNEFKVFGKGVRVGIFSSGANVNHEALKPRYLGTLPDGKFNHNYSWYEGFPTVIPEPNDAINIGTHITGTICGETRYIGLAPKARFMSCKGVDNLGRDAPEYHLQCHKFFYAPTDVNGTFPRYERRPHIVNIQYCDSCGDDFLLIEVIENLRRAGIVVLSPSGQAFEGAPKCLRVNRPPANYPMVLTIGGLTLNGLTLETSAAGPPVFNGSVTNAYIKPNLVTLGEEVESSVFLDNVSEYFPATGSSVAGAVATGAVALVISSNRKISRKVRVIEEIMLHGATPRFSNACNLKSRTPNDEYGFGEVNAYRSVLRARQYPYGSCPERPYSNDECDMDPREALFVVEQDISVLVDESQRIHFVLKSNTVQPGDFGHPDEEKNERFKLCVYDTVNDVSVSGKMPSILNSGYKIPTHGGAIGSWESKETEDAGKFIYHFRANKTYAKNDGIIRVKLDEKRGKIEVIGRGRELPLSRARSQWNPLPVYEAYKGIIVQWYSSSSGKCFGAHFKRKDIKKNNVREFSSQKD